MSVDRGPKRLSRPASPVKTPRPVDLFSIQALVFNGLARRFYIYLQIYNK